MVARSQPSSPLSITPKRSQIILLTTDTIGSHDVDTVATKVGIDTQVHAVVGALGQTITALDLSGVAGALLDILGDVLRCYDRVRDAVGDGRSEGGRNSRGEGSGEETRDEGSGKHLEDW